MTRFHIIQKTGLHKTAKVHFKTAQSIFQRRNQLSGNGRFGKSSL